MGTVIDFPNKKNEISFDDASNQLQQLIDKLPGKTYLIYACDSDDNKARVLASKSMSLNNAIGLLRRATLILEKGL